ncbi:hypothetical protein H8I69_05995 [Serratia fonticola]|uniref:hypothetical protein n=1 Tax=Serratia fonticola TaxID=47917 RepID=UPI0015C67BFA|nr:hypothetical protein [Serratia fonticola]MBC3378669.1 hypothetical protein [Serratia fonticola]NYA37869.1 hypothetical protein [Serratia fonticola]
MSNINYGIFIILYFICFWIAPPIAAETVNFIGAVTNITCDVYVEVDGVPGNVVDLGRVGTSNPSADGRYFRLKPEPYHPGCLTLTAQDKVVMTWAGDFSSPTGFLSAQSGGALDATVYIMQDQRPYSGYIMRGSLSAYVDGETFLREGSRYFSAIIPGRLTGTFQAAAAFVISYP